MPIRFTCSHCGRGLTVRDELAGRHGRCPYCKEVLMVPAARAVKPLRDPKKPDLESLALAALGLAGGPSKAVGETVAASETVAGPTPSAAPIQVICSWCDHKFSVEAELAGKQTPCPECRRIVKVPAPQTQSPRDWRQASRGPTAAALAQPRLEGEWGTATSRSYVSTEALEEAEVLPVEREPLTPGQWALRIGLGVVLVVIIYTGYRLYASYRTENRKNSLLAEAELALQQAQAVPEQAACIRLALAHYWQQTDTDDNRVRGVSRRARHEAALALQEIQKLASQHDWSALASAQDLSVEYLTQCCIAGLLSDDLRPAVQLLHRFPNQEVLARRVVQRIIREAGTPERRDAALRRLGQQLATLRSTAEVRPEVHRSDRAAAATQYPPTLFAVLVESATLGATETARQLMEQLTPDGQDGKQPVGQVASAALGDRRRLLAERLVRTESLDNAGTLLDEIEYLARRGQLQEAWERYEKEVAPRAPALERWRVVRMLVEFAVLHHAPTILEKLANELDRVAQGLPLHLGTDVQTTRMRIFSALGKEDVTQTILEQAGQGELRRALLRVQAETLLLCSPNYLPPESLAFLTELPAGERVYLLHRLAWHNVRADRAKTQRWLSSLSGADRAIVAAVVLAHDTALPSR
ncbi:MAG: hypothetical protein NZM42_02120 [Gemmatales bacterium]|nr:hypothetical protein [Gemmatales bacterium]MDW8221842.1 hypothetical protein [Gemmatales bacterium]